MRALAILLILLAGCSAAGLSFDGRAENAAIDDTKTAACDTDALLAVHLGLIASGTVRVQVEDAAGSVLFDRSFGAQEEASIQERLAGEPGDWTLRMQAEDYTGRYTISLIC